MSPRAPNTNDEWVDVVDERDRVIGRVTRAQMRREHLLHRVVAVLCVRCDGAIYLQRRTATKDLFPRFYDMFVAGVVESGEGYDDAARRELAEELGITGPRPEFLFMHRYEGPETRSHTAVYRVRWDGPIYHQSSEVEWGRYASLAELRDNPEGLLFVPDGAEIFQRYLRECRHPGGRAREQP